MLQMGRIYEIRSATQLHRYHVQSSSLKVTPVPRK